MNKVHVMWTNNRMEKTALCKFTGKVTHWDTQIIYTVSLQLESHAVLSTYSPTLAVAAHFTSNVRA